MKYWHVPCYQWLRRSEVYWLSVPFVVLSKVWPTRGFFTTCSYRHFRSVLQKSSRKNYASAGILGRELLASEFCIPGARFVSTKQNKTTCVSWEMTAVSDTIEIWKAFIFWRFQCVIYENTKLIWLSVDTLSHLFSCANKLQTLWDQQCLWVPPVPPPWVKCRYPRYCGADMLVVFGKFSGL